MGWLRASVGARETGPGLDVGRHHVPVVMERGDVVAICAAVVVAVVAPVGGEG